MRPADPVLTAAQMRAAEEALIAAGTSVDALMLRAGQGAAEWVWRMAAGRAVTVLCGPGNNGGDGWVIAETLRARGGEVVVVTAGEPRTDAARAARAGFGGVVLDPAARPRGEVLVDCLYGTGLSRPLAADDAVLLRDLAAGNHRLVAVDLPSGFETDSGAMLSDAPLRYDLTLALGAWKPAHFLLPAAATMGRLELIDIGVSQPGNAAFLIGKPQLAGPDSAAHKYSRGLLGVIGGAMPGAAMLAARAAQHGGAGYIKLLGHAVDAPADLVVHPAPLAEALGDGRLSALLVGPGLGRDAAAMEALALALAKEVPAVIDADALTLLGPRNLAERSAPLIATPHGGELAALERAFDLSSAGSKPDRAQALAQATGMVVVAKGADTVVAAPDGRLAFARPASSWLSTAGTGDVLAGIVASRLATGADAFDAACAGVWLHGEAARLSAPAFTAGQLAEAVQDAYAAAL